MHRTCCQVRRTSSLPEAGVLAEDATMPKNNKEMHNRTTLPTEFRNIADILRATPICFRVYSCLVVVIGLPRLLPVLSRAQHAVDISFVL
eukprot:1176236-Prorocentrum_minimum.AAC.2